MNISNKYELPELWVPSKLTVARKGHVKEKIISTGRYIIFLF